MCHGAFGSVSRAFVSVADQASSVTLSDAAIENLDITTAKAELSKRAEAITVNAMIEYRPERRTQFAQDRGQGVRIALQARRCGGEGEPRVVLDPIFVGGRRSHSRHPLMAT